ncbi:hypothetical protein [Streptomyces chartreusis]
MTVVLPGALAAATARRWLRGPELGQRGPLGLGEQGGGRGDDGERGQGRVGLGRRTGVVEVRLPDSVVVGKATDSTTSGGAWGFSTGPCASTALVSTTAV